MTTLKLARETWRLTSSVSHGKSQGEHTSVVSHTKSQVSKSCEALPKAKTESLVSILQKPRYLAKAMKNVKFL